MNRNSSRNPLVSILVPIYNVEATIERCARSLFEQTYNNIEYIFVDDCSPDNSVSVLKKVLVEYPQRKEYVHIVAHSLNRGVAAARNTAVAAATGKFLSYVDPDDWIELDAIEIMVRRQEETGADIVSGNSVSHYKNNTEICTEPDYKSKEEMLHDKIRMNFQHNLWRRLIRTDLYKSNGIVSVEGVNIGEDMQQICQLVWYAQSFSKVDSIVYHYDCSTVSSTRKFDGKFDIDYFTGAAESLRIIRDFFRGKDDYCVRGVEESLKYHIELSRNEAVRRKDYAAYKIVVNGTKYSNFSFWPYFALIAICKLIRKLTGRRIGPLNLDNVVKKYSARHMQE